MTKAKAPMQTAVTKVSSPVQSSFARIKNNGFKFPSFGKKTPPIIDTKKAPATNTIAKKSKWKPKSKSSQADALAWKRKKEAEAKKSKEKALVPKDFEASDLDVGGQVPTYGILPSLKPGERTSINELDELAILPADVANIPSIPSIRPRPKAPDLSTVPDYLKPVGPVPAIKDGE